MIERHQSCSDGVICLRIIAHDIEGGREETSDIRRVSSISDADDVSVSLDTVGVVREISRIVGWFGVDLVIQHIDAVATSVSGVGVPFDTGEMRGIIEVPSLAVVLLCVSQIVLDPRLVIGGFVMLKERGFRRGSVFTAVRLGIVIGLIVCGGAVLAGGLTRRVMVTGTIRNHDENFLGDVFVRAIEFYLLSGGDIHVGDLQFGVFSKKRQKLKYVGKVSTHTPGTLSVIPLGVLNHLAKLTLLKPIFHSERVDNVYSKHTNTPPSRRAYPLQFPDHGIIVERSR